MPIELIHEAGAPDANTLVSLARANYYFERRLPLNPPWITTGDTPAMLLIMATRVLTVMNTPKRALKWDRAGKPYYYTPRTWQGELSTLTQSLVFPRKNLKDMLGRDVPEDIVPEEIEFVTAELAGQLRIADRTLDNDIKLQGISSITAGPVALEFKDMIETQVLPDAVMNLIPPSFLSDEVIDYQIFTAEVMSL